MSSRGLLRRQAPTEHEDQCVVIAWADLHAPRYPDLAYLFAVPNAGAGGSRGQAGKMRAEGVRSGVADLRLDRPRGGWSGLSIELKVGQNTATPGQRRWLLYDAAQCGRLAALVRGADRAIGLIRWYVRQPAGNAIAPPPGLHRAPFALGFSRVPAWCRAWAFDLPPGD